MLKKVILFLIIVNLTFAFEKDEKLLYSNILFGSAILGWGVATWDYGERSPHAKSEGWFSKNTKYGGADKSGHLYTAYLSSHLLANLYKYFGYNKEKAIEYGALSAFGLTAIMEFGDSFSDYGFSYEDFLMNSLGAYLGYILYKNRFLSSKIDLRFEMKPNSFFDKGDVFTNYEEMKHLIAIKLSGFDTFKDTYLKYFEFHLGYYMRSYQKELSRNLYIGFGINLSKLLDNFDFSKIFNYYQLPASYVKLKRELN